MIKRSSGEGGVGGGGGTEFTNPDRCVQFYLRLPIILPLGPGLRILTYFDRFGIFRPEPKLSKCHAKN